MPRIAIFTCLLALIFCIEGCSHTAKEPSAVDVAAPTDASPTLYSRLGGEEFLKNFANQFVSQLALNNKIMMNPLIAGALSKNQKDHKEKLTTLLCQITGGPCKYEAGSLKEAHKPLKISRDEWKEMTRVFIQVLQKMKVPKNERRELATQVAKFKSQIVAGS